MEQIFERYAYFGFSLILFALCAGLTALQPRRHRRSLVAAGLLATPAGLFDGFFIPSYWQPVTLLGTSVGPEDLVFSYAVGSISVYLAYGKALPSGAGAPPAMIAWGRYCGAVFGYVLILCVLIAAGVRVMHAALAGMAAVGTIVLWERPGLSRAGLRSAIGFAAFYLIALLGAFAAWPELAGQWAAAEVSGQRVISIPSGEIAWALVYGWVYPTLFGSVMALPAPERKTAHDRRAVSMARGVP